MHENPPESPSVLGKPAIEKAGVLDASGKRDEPPALTAKERAWIAEMDAEPWWKGYCYFAGWRDQVKIGYSRDVDRRLDEIRCKFLLDKIELLAVAHGHRFREAFYHKRFAADHLHNEWFRRTPEIESEIARLRGEDA